MVRKLFLWSLQQCIQRWHAFCFIFWLPAIGVEPWTFEQKVGEAVFIPAGCPHQVRNLKVWLTFTSDNQAGYFSFSFCLWHQISWFWLMRPSSFVQSCIKVALDFVSPENVGECVKLTAEFRRLPSFHPAKEDKLEVSTVYFKWSGLRLWLILSDVTTNLELDMWVLFFRSRRWPFMPWTKL